MDLNLFTSSKELKYDSCLWKENEGIKYFNFICCKFLKDDKNTNLMFLLILVKMTQLCLYPKFKETIIKICGQKLHVAISSIKTDLKNVN